MCTLIIYGMLPFIECGQLGWLGAPEVDFVHFWLDLVHLMPPWDSKPPIFTHPRIPRCNNFPTSSQPRPFINLWLFGMIWSVIGPPRGDWCQFGNFDLYTHIGLPKPQETLMMYYKPVTNMFLCHIIKNNLVLFTFVCVNYFSIHGFCWFLHQIWFVSFSNAPRFSYSLNFSHSYSFTYME